MSNSWSWGTISSCVVAGQRDGLADRLEPLGVLDVHPVRPLEEGEVAEGGLTERHQLDPDAGRVGVGAHREVRPGEPRGGPDGRQQVLHERQVEHLLRADLQQRLAPALDRGERLGGQPLVDRLLEREGREQVLEHDEVLELGRLAERVDQGLPVLEAPRVCVIRPPPDLQDAGQRTVRSGRDVLEACGDASLGGRGASLVEPVVRIAPLPILAGLDGANHRVPRLAEVGRGVPVRAQVAAARAPAGEALAEMDPRVADLDARGADPDRRIDPEVGLEVLAERRHVAVRPMPVGRRIRVQALAADTSTAPPSGRARWS